MFFRNPLSSRKQAELKISVVGGSNSVMRRGYTKYLGDHLAKLTKQKTSVRSYSLGGVTNIFAAIQEDRHDIAAKSEIIFFEYCVNDRHAIEIDHYNLELAGKSLEGFIRKCQKSNPYCLIVLLIFGVNKEDYYQQNCAVSELYESIGEHYCLPVVNITEILRQQRGLSFIQSLYSGDDIAHYSRPHGVQTVAQIIAAQLEKNGIVNSLKSDKNSPRSNGVEPIYQDNLENLRFFANFKQGNYFPDQPKVSIYQNSVFREQNFTLTPGNSLRFLLKGKFVGLYIKSDLNDGLIEIKFGTERIVVSSYSEWVTKIRPNNINLITLPLRRFTPAADFKTASVSCCQEYSANFELDYIKQVPVKQNPQQWRLNIIGVAYIGELKPPPS